MCENILCNIICVCVCVYMCLCVCMYACVCVCHCMYLFLAPDMEIHERVCGSNRRSRGSSVVSVLIILFSLCWLFWYFEFAFVYVFYVLLCYRYLVYFVGPAHRSYVPRSVCFSSDVSPPFISLGPSHSFHFLQ